MILFKFYNFISFSIRFFFEWNNLLKYFFNNFLYFFNNLILHEDIRSIKQNILYNFPYIRIYIKNKISIGFDNPIYYSSNYYTDSIFNLNRTF